MEMEFRGSGTCRKRRNSGSGFLQERRNSVIRGNGAMGGKRKVRPSDGWRRENWVVRVGGERRW